MFFENKPVDTLLFARIALLVAVELREWVLSYVEVWYSGIM
jgi:hypothetical protein